MKKAAIILLVLVAALSCTGMWLMYGWYEARLAEPERAAFVIADKGTMRLKVYDADGGCIADFPMACGRNYGNKRAPGDNRTPEGVFRISDIQNSSGWTHDFNDGKGEVAGAYGGWFLRLETGPHKGIGIHGTHAPESLGRRATEGCIRLANSDIDSLRRLAYCGLNVIILPSRQDILTDSTAADSVKLGEAQ